MALFYRALILVVSSISICGWFLQISFYPFDYWGMFASVSKSDHIIYYRLVDKSGADIEPETAIGALADGRFWQRAGECFNASAEWCQITLEAIATRLNLNQVSLRQLRVDLKNPEAPKVIGNIGFDRHLPAQRSKDEGT